MKRLMIALALAAIATPAMAQRNHEAHVNAGANLTKNVRLHINPRWKECSFQLDATLTQAAWRQFTGEAAVVTHFKPLVDARPMGKGKWELSMLQWKTGIDDEEAAWNDTFVHPDSTHWLFEGSGLQFPGLTARMGLSDRTDLGVYFTKSPGANYGFYGLQAQQNLVSDAESNWAAAARVSFVSMYGPEDLENTVYGADLVVSRSYGLWSDRLNVSPYAVVTGTLSRSHEKSAVVSLKDENVFGAQGTVGAAVRAGGLSVAVEYGAARVSSFSMKIGFSRGAH